MLMLLSSPSAMSVGKPVVFDWKFRITWEQDTGPQTPAFSAWLEGTACIVLTDANGGNCQIDICFPARDDADGYFTTADKLYRKYYKQIEDNCFPSKAGGKASVWIDPFVWLEVINYAPPTKKHRDVVRNVSLAELHGDLSKRADTTFDVIDQKLSIENPAVKLKIGGQLDHGS
ncbi:hypothetical protein FALBO_11451 [Fusarium albosuccineum]|uniref:Uncharacterized protein n=1 Tax=Fusarium albosuccineum TaxID=1237068 RepID=A0A8H4L5W7_9HYPO|nr:hypothetical protein FALBO_11451 [Fusarium albosuccineum]